MKTAGKTFGFSPFISHSKPRDLLASAGNSGVNNRPLKPLGKTQAKRVENLQGDTVDGRNPAPPGMYKTLQIMA